MTFKKMKYHFDNLMSKGTIVLVTLLFSITLVIVLLAGLFSMLLDGTEHSFLHSIWTSFMYTLDAGNLAGAEGNAAFVATAMLVTLCGLFFTSMLIGIINAGIENKMTSLKRGKSHVFEQDHIIVLGLNETAFLMLNELVIAGENHRRQVIVVLDEQNKEDIEETIRHHIPDAKTTRFICRSGSPDSMADLAICSPETCRSIILTSDDDYSSLKSVLALSKLLGSADNARMHITAIVQDAHNIRAITIAGEGRVEAIGLQNTIARIIAHSCLQPGISAVYTELFNFDGDEIYVEAMRGVAELRFDQAALGFGTSTLIGIVRDGTPLLNPPPDTTLRDDDRLILIAADDGVSAFAKSNAQIHADKIAGEFIAVRQPKRMLVIGYNETLPDIVTEEDHYLPAGSQITVVLHRDFSGAQERLAALTLTNIALSIESSDLSSYESLEFLLLGGFDNVLILSDLSVSRNEADIESMRLLIYLRDIAERKSLSFSVTTEVQNAETQQLISSDVSTDFIVGSHITAMIAAQVSQTRELAAIFSELLNEYGSEIYIKPAAKYVTLATPVDLYTATAAVAGHNEVLIGYRKRMANGLYETVINPAKASEVSFGEEDGLIVLAEG